MAQLTTDQSSTPLWVVPIGHISFPQMRSNYSRRSALQSDYRCIIGVQPTGWTFTDNARSRPGELLSKKTKGSDVIYGCPYSEHSSFDQLQDCVRYLNPRRIIPTVNCSSAAKVQEQLALLSVS